MFRNFIDVTIGLVIIFGVINYVNKDYNYSLANNGNLLKTSIIESENNNIGENDSDNVKNDDNTELYSDDILDNYNSNDKQVSNNIVKNDINNVEQTNIVSNRYIKKDLNISDLYTTVKWGKTIQSVSFSKYRYKIMKNKGYSNERILILSTILSMECNDKLGNCFNGYDVGPFQINKIHTDRYNISKKLYDEKKWDELFLYQLDKANNLIDGYESNNCKDDYIKKYGVGNTFEQKKWRCIAYHYNGHPRYKISYNTLGYVKMNMIRDYTNID